MVLKLKRASESPGEPVKKTDHWAPTLIFLVVQAWGWGQETCISNPGDVRPHTLRTTTSLLTVQINLPLLEVRAAAILQEASLIHGLRASL